MFLANNNQKNRSATSTIVFNACKALQRIFLHLSSKGQLDFARQSTEVEKKRRTEPVITDSKQVHDPFPNMCMLKCFNSLPLSLSVCVCLEPTVTMPRLMAHPYISLSPSSLSLSLCVCVYLCYSIHSHSLTLAHTHAITYQLG